MDLIIAREKDDFSFYVIVLDRGVIVTDGERDLVSVKTDDLPELIRQLQNAYECILSHPGRQRALADGAE